MEEMGIEEMSSGYERPAPPQAIGDGLRDLRATLADTHRILRKIELYGLRIYLFGFPLLTIRIPAGEYVPSPPDVYPIGNPQGSAPPQ